MALARIPNQGDYEIDDTLLALPENTQAARAQRDNLVRRALAFVPSVLNADLTYKEEHGKQVVIVTPHLGRKAFFAAPLDDFHASLRAAPFSAHPALSLALELHARFLDSTIDPAELLLAYGPRLASVAEQVEYQHAKPFEAICQRLKELKGRPLSGPCAGF